MTRRSARNPQRSPTHPSSAPAAGPPQTVIDVHVIPRAGKTELAGTRDSAILVRVSAPPVEGAANDAVVTLLASLLHVPRSSIQIVGGERSRRKRVAIAGLAPAQVRAMLAR